jgi:hypothetical protein
MAAALSLVDAIDELVTLATDPTHSRPFRGLLAERLSALDAIIGSECQRIGIQIPHLGETSGANIQFFGFTGLPYAGFVGGSMMPMPSRNWLQGMRGLRILALNATASDSNDTSYDQEQKSEKRRTRTMNRAAADCARRFKAERRRDPTISMRGVIKEYVAEQGGSVESIMRILNDNPGQWKPQEKSREIPTKKRQKDDH